MNRYDALQIYATKNRMKSSCLNRNQKKSKAAKAEKLAELLTIQEWDGADERRKFKTSKYGKLGAFERWHFKSIVQEAFLSGHRAGKRPRTDDDLQFCLGEVLRLPKTKRTNEVADIIARRIKRVPKKKDTPL